MSSRLFPKPPDRRSAIGRSHLEIGQSKAATASPTVLSRQLQKTVLRLDLPREKVVDAFFEADLFVFASKVEYSPLVLFESAAAGTPFLTVPVGNAGRDRALDRRRLAVPGRSRRSRLYQGIASGLGAGNGKGYPFSGLLFASSARQAGKRWLDRFTWAKIAKSYERILRGETVISPMRSDAVEGAVGG